MGWHGATEIYIFDGIMDAAMYVRIVQVALLPTLQRPEYEKGHRFIQENNPKHTSRVAKAFFAESGVNWWRPPPPPPPHVHVRFCSSCLCFLLLEHENAYLLRGHLPVRFDRIII